MRALAVIAGCVAGLAASASADFIQTGSARFGPRSVPTPSVVPNDTASMTLIMYAAGGTPSAPINAGGQVLVQRGPAFTNMGANVNGVGSILGSWDEQTAGSHNVVQAIWKTSNREDIIPFGSRIGGAGGPAAVFWLWQFGATDPVNFQSWVTSVDLRSARISFSTDGGLSYPTSFNITNSLANPWDGRDMGVLQTLVGSGINAILARYEFDPIPAPGAIGVLGLGLFAMGRRRR